MRLIKVRFLVVLAWVLFLAVLLSGLEIFARYKQNYQLMSIKLNKSSYFEMDKTKIWNKKFVEEHKSYFKNWPIPLEAFEATKSSPMYIFKPSIKMASVNGKLISARPNDQIFWSSGAWGFRGKDFSFEKPKNVIRIVTLGASTTEGSQSDNETYPFYLQSKLMEGGYNVEVINAGHHGHSIDDLLEVFKQRIIPLKPDVVVFYEVSNNIYPGEWLKEKWANWDSWDVGYGKIFRIFHQTSAVFSFLTEQLGVEKIRPPIIAHTFDLDKDKPKRNNFELKVREIVKIAKENEIKPVLTTFITVASDNLAVDFNQNKTLWKDLYFKWYPFTPGEIAEIYDSYNQGLKKIAQDENVLLIDLSSQFPKDQNYFVDHVHFTPEGNRLLANSIAGFLSKEVLSKNGVSQK